MSTNRSFFQITLRTSDEAKGRAFYAAVLGIDPASLDAYPLHENAIARGAKPHWLGFIDVGEVDPVAAAFAARGSTVRGPKWVNPKGLEAAIMHDPGGALIALAKPAPVPPPSQPIVAGCVLNTADVETAKKNYGELLGWAFGAPVTLAGQGTFFPFSYTPGGPQAGVFGDVAGRPGVHPQWLFQLRVADLSHALTTARSLGAVVADASTLPNGDRVAVLDDPQGAAFALRQLS